MKLTDIVMIGLVGVGLYVAYTMFRPIQITEGLINTEDEGDAFLGRITVS